MENMAPREARGLATTQAVDDSQAIASVANSQRAGSRLGDSQLSVQISLSPVSQSARAALEDAVESFNRDVPSSKASELIDKRTEFATLSKYAQKELALRYGEDTVPQRKRDRLWRSTKRGMEKFSKTIYNYKGVMDVLVSAHPEIASLAWGAMKFLLAVSVNHQELREKIIDNLAEIGEQFKIVDTYVRMFPEEDMVEHVCNAHADFLTFLQLSIDWCKENAIVKFFKNVAQPYDARIKPTIDSLSKCIRRIEARVQVHNTHGILRNGIGITDIQGQNMVLQEGVNDLQTLMMKLGAATYIQSSSNNEILKLLKSLADDAYGRPAVDLGAQPRQRIDSISSAKSEKFRDEFTIKERIFPELLQAPDHANESSMESRRLGACYSHAVLGLETRPEVKEWIRCRYSRLLWIDGYQDSQQAKWTTEFAADVMLAAENSRSAVLYYFGDLANNVLETEQAFYLSSPRAIIHSFILQMIQQYPLLLKQESQLFKRANFEAARRSLKSAWVLFMHTVSYLPTDSIVYLIFDSADTVADLTAHQREFKSLLRKISRLASSREDSPTFKVLITSVTSSASEELFSTPGEDRVNATKLSHGGIILRIPQTFGQTNVVQPASHLRKRVPQRLVRLPDSDEEFGMRPVNSFDFSDDEHESIAFSSDDATDEDEARPSKAKRVTTEQTVDASFSALQQGRDSGQDGSSSDMTFSDGEDTKGKARAISRSNTIDIEFSSDDE